jgi:alpha-tubulin suppressor-like RCC1 family protein
LGNGTTTSSNTPVEVNGLSGIVAVAAGTSHTLALKSDGTVWAWGYDGLGSATISSSDTPVQVSGLSNIIAIAAGVNSSIAVKADGTVWTWGDNSLGQLGNGFAPDPGGVPIQVPGLSGVVGAAAGGLSDFVVKSDGTVWGWGYAGCSPPLPDCGGFGNNHAGGYASPVQVPISGVKAVAVSGLTTGMALKSDGTVWYWGGAVYQLSGVSNVEAISGGPFGGLMLKSDGTVWNFINTPTQVSGVSNVVAIAAGGSSDAVLEADGTVWTWGDNSQGELGNGTNTNSTTPVQVSNLTGVVAIAAGTQDFSGEIGADYVLAVQGQGAVAAWGMNAVGQLGNGTLASSTTPVPASNLSSIAAIAAGSGHSLALKSDGTAWAWGYNTYGQLGNGTNANSWTPIQVNDLSSVVAVSGGGIHSLALRSDGTVWAWGDNSDGQLGSLSVTTTNTPVQTSNLSGVVAIAAGYFYSLALRSDGTVWAWGSGESVNGTNTTIFTPVQVSNLSSVVAIAAGTDTSLALKSDGTVWAWGDNSYGELGDGTNGGIVGTPIQVSNLSGVVAIAVGQFYCLALKSDGTVWAWGYNADGELGNGTTTNSDTPVQVENLANVAAIAAGTYHNLALKSDGPIWGWGSNGDGELGNGSTTSSITPVQVSNLSGVASISAGDEFSLAVVNAGPNGVATAAFAGTDTSTQGSWYLKYGKDGDSVALVSQSIPSYATFAVQNQLSWTWATTTIDPRALQVAGPGGVNATCWYNTTSFSFDVNVGASSHQFAMYAVDWDNQGRTETITILDASTNLTLSSQTISNFEGGIYLVWYITGHVRIIVTPNSGPNAVVSGVFFGTALSPLTPILGITKTHTGNFTQGQHAFYTVTVSNQAGAGPTSGTVTVTENPPSGLAIEGMAGTGWACTVPTCSRNDVLNSGLSYPPITVTVNVAANATSPQINAATVSGGGSASANANDSTVINPSSGSSGPSASFVKADTSTQGNWMGVYGSDASAIANGPQSANPSYGTFAVQQQLNWTWASSTADTRALETDNQGDRIAAAWYSPAAFNFDVNLTDSNPHQVALYVLDWDGQGRAETIQIADASNPSNVLNTQAVSSFGNGIYLVWTITGHVTITVTPSTGPNGVVSGIFFGGGGSAPSSATASWVASDTTTQGAWIGKYGSGGYSLANAGQNFVVPATFAVQGSLTPWTWASDPTPPDPRDLETDANGDQIAAAWYSPASFYFDLNLTDGKTHQIALYVLDWDDHGRQETIQVVDANSGATLDTRVIPDSSGDSTSTNTTSTNFQNGTYLIWNVSGHVKINVTTGAGPNAVVSGVFINN